MKASKKIIELVVRELAGEDAIPIIDMLLKNESVSEYEISDRIKRDINQTRNMLYSLHKYNLVFSARKKDKIKGWYIYYWSFDQQRICEAYVNIQQKKIERTKSTLERETNSSFFACPNGCIRLDFEHAMAFNFKCPECGSLMEKDDNAKKLLQLKKQLDILENEYRKK
jgi:transcription initiation factor TFIIE subunit alpha